MAKPLEQVGAGFNHQLLNELLRGQFGFRGVIVSDWAITNDCSEACRNGTAAGAKPTPAEIGMPWGVEELTKAQRFAKAINAGVDQIGGTEESSLIVENVHNGSTSEARVREAAASILLQKFELGLFEQPYVDEAKAAVIAGNKDFAAEGQAAQARAVVLLENKSVASTGQPRSQLQRQPATRFPGSPFLANFRFADNPPATSQKSTMDNSRAFTIHPKRNGGQFDAQ